MYIITLQLVRAAVFNLEGLPSGDADAVELGPTAVRVCGAAHKGKHRLFRGV